MGGKYRFDEIPPEERKRLAELCGLTEEEVQVFEARARTGNVIAAAERINTSECTIKRRSASIARKLARRGRVDAMRTRTEPIAINQ